MNRTLTLIRTLSPDPDVYLSPNPNPTPLLILAETQALILIITGGRTRIRRTDHFLILRRIQTYLTTFPNPNPNSNANPTIARTPEGGKALEGARHP